MSAPENLVEVKNLKRYFKVGSHAVLKAVDDVSFTIKAGETFGLVGESGCGKTTCGRTVVGLYPASGGEVKFRDIDVRRLKGMKKREFARRAQIIFQDPYASLNPRMTVGDIVGEGISIHGLYSGKEKMDRVYALLQMVGLNKEQASRFPHEFSGGQRQRIGIARALAVEPEFIVCDEPISALDVSIQAQIVNLLINLQKDLGLTYLFIAHDLAMVKHISDKVGVMYLGKLVETSPCELLYSHPLHPYTRALLSAIPIADPKISKARELIPLEGEVTSPINPKSGCRFAQRCKYATQQCFEADPPAKEIEPGHFVSCFLY